MTRSVRVLLALAAAALTAVAAGAASSVPSAFFTVKAGQVTAVVNGQTKTYKTGDQIPDQAVVTGDPDAEVAASNGVVLRVPKGATYQAAVGKGGVVDVKVTAGVVKFDVNVSGMFGELSLGAGSEAAVSKQDAQVISGSAAITSDTGRTQTLNAGQHIKGMEFIHFSFTLGQAAVPLTSILVAPAPPSQQSTVVSASAP